MARGVMSILSIILERDRRFAMRIWGIDAVGRGVGARI